LIIDYHWQKALNHWNLARDASKGMNRWKASAIHFGISQTGFLILLAIMLLLWYPGILFRGEREVRENADET
jgi:hypothetical protein